jgi:hypothetical protein
MGEHGDGTQAGGPDRAEALAALRKAVGLERLLGRLRAGGDDRDATSDRGPATRRPPVPIEDHAAHAA